MANVRIERVLHGFRLYLDGHEVRELVDFTLRAPIDGITQLTLTLNVEDLEAGLGPMRLADQQPQTEPQVVGPQTRQVELVSEEQHVQTTGTASTQE